MISKEAKYFQVEQHEFMRIIGRAFRYAMTRDNHLEPDGTFNDLILYIKNLEVNKDYWCQKLLDEINDIKRWDEVKWSVAKQKSVENFEKFLIEELDNSKENNYKESNDE